LSSALRIQLTAARDIELTAKGVALRKSAKDAKRTWLGQAIAQLDREKQATLFAAGEIIKRLVEL